MKAGFNTAAVLAGLLLAGVAPNVHSETHTVFIDGGFFDPMELAINVGDTVEWYALEPDHTVTSDTGVFDSGNFWESVPFGEKFTHVFTSEGQFGYHCTVHGAPGGGMFGTIFVNAGSGNQAPNTPVNLLPANDAIDQPLTVQLVAGPFSDPDPLDFHSASQWIVRRASDNQIVFDSGTDTVNRTNRVVPAGLLAEGSNYVWQVRYQDGRDGWSDYSVPTGFRTLVAVPANGIGLRGSFYNSAMFSPPLAVVTNATIDFNWGDARPHRRITSDHFAVRWEGFILPEFTETYRVQFQFKGGARVWVNNQLVIDEWNGCGFNQSRWGTIALVGGQLASIRIDYAAEAPEPAAVLRWASPSQLVEVIPTNRMFPATP